MNIFTQAHQITKQIIKSSDDYRATFALALKAIYEGFTMSKINSVREYEKASAAEKKEWINSFRKEIQGSAEEVAAVNEALDNFAEEVSQNRRRNFCKVIYNFMLNEFSSKPNLYWLINYNEEKAIDLYPVEYKEVKAAREEAAKADEARREAEKQAEIERRAAQNDGFPELKGTVKQVAWANDIRRAMCTVKLGHTFDDVQREALKSVNRAKTAKYWIDNYRTVYKKYQ